MGILVARRVIPVARDRWLRWPPVAAMVRLDLLTALTSLTPYAAAAAVLALAALLLQNDLHRIREDGLLVRGEPFALPVAAAGFLLAVVLATWAALAVARDREQGALELLCYGPVSPAAYLLARLVGLGLLASLLLLVVLGGFVLLSAATGLHLGLRATLVLLLLTGPLAGAAGVGLAVAGAVRRARPAVLAVLGLALAGVGLQVAHEVLARLPTPEFHVSPVQVVRWAAFLLSRVTGWALPFGYVDRLMGAVLHGDAAQALPAALAPWLYAAVLLALGTVALERTGVRR